MQRNFFIFAILLLVAVYVSTAKKLPPPIRGFKFTKCYRKCKASSEDLQSCGKQCLKKMVKRVTLLEKERKEKEEKVKAMADFGIPGYAWDELRRKNLTIKPMPTMEYTVKTDSNGDFDPAEGERLWSQYRQELFSFFKQGNTRAMKNFQLLPQAYPISDETLNLFLDFMPKWSNSYERTNEKFSENYNDFMMNQNVNDATWTPAIQALAEQLDAATQAMEIELGNCLVKYENLATNLKPDFETFKKTRCYSVDRTTNEQRRIFYLFESEKRKLPGGTRLYEAKTNFFNAMGNYNWRPMTKISSFAENAKKGAVTSFDVTIHQSTSTSIQTAYSTSWGFDVSVCIYGVTIGVGGQFSKSKMNMKTTQREFHLKVGAAGYMVIPLYPDTWLDYGILTQYRNGPFKQPKTYWGPNGSLRLLPKSLFVVVGPRVEMYVVKEDAEAMETMKSNSMKVSVGYMGIFNLGFNFGKGSSMKTSTMDNKMYKVELFGNSYEPQILAIDYDAPNWE